jgi:hypothetical protein
LIQWSARENGTEILQYNPWELVVSPEDKRNDSFYIVFTGGVIIHDPFDPVRILNAIGRFWVFGEIAFLCPERQRNAMVSAINRNDFRETNSLKNHYHPSISTICWRAWLRKTNQDIWMTRTGNRFKAW